MPERHKVVITLEDMPDGSTSVTATPNVKVMIEKTRRGPMAKSMAVAFAMSALTHIANENRRLIKEGSGRPIIILPPGVRGRDN